MAGISLLSRADDILRGRTGPESARPSRRLAWCVLGCGSLYGAVMGSFGALVGGPSGQVLISAAKVPILLLATLVLCLPTFFVLNTLLGVRHDFGRALRAILGSQAGLTIVLASLSPFTALWYASSADYNAAILFNAAMFGLSAASAQWPLRRAYRPLIAANRTHQTLLRAWLVLYAFVGVQMAWLLRPFVGNPDLPVRFFRGGSWENAYVIVARMVWDQLTR